MAWFKVDDGFYDHPKLEGVSMAARGLWVTAGAYCSRHLTDGVITARQVRLLGGTRAQITALVDSGLWVRFRGDSGTDSYAFHDWFDMQPSRKEVEEKREAEAERKRKWREAKAAKQQERQNVPAGQTPDVPQESRVTSALPDPTRPDPARLPLFERKGEGSVTHADTPPHCASHPGGTDKPCTPCAQARRAHQQDEAARIEQAKIDRSTAARLAAQERREAIDGCGLCDEDGYRGTTVCDHVDHTETARSGLAAVQAVLDKTRQA